MAEQDRILVVDDDRGAGELIAMVLAEAGFVAESAVDGLEALAIVAARPPDFLLTDLEMPGMDGLELIRRIHDLDPGLPAALMTGAETANLCTGASAYGAVACLPKPISLDDLLWIIDCALECRRGVARPTAGVASA
jgi:DNA-binding NtrC family response regulator